MQLACALGAVRQGPGLLIFSASGRCMFRNQQAKHLIRELHGSRTQGRAAISLPTALTGCVQDVIDLLQRHPNRGSWEQVELTRVLRAEQRLVLARFYAVPSADTGAQLEWVIGLLEPLPITAQPTDMLRTQFRLSERERSCVTHLVQGMTDKEIANQLGISEYTVKAHLKQVRKKTGASNRTGIIARVLGQPEGAASTARTVQSALMSTPRVSGAGRSLAAGEHRLLHDPS